MVRRGQRDVTSVAVPRHRTLLHSVHKPCFENQEKRVCRDSGLLGKGVCLLGPTSSWLRVQETSCTFSGVPAAASWELTLASGSSGLHAHDRDCTEVVFKAVTIYCVSVHICRCGSGSQWGGREMHPNDSYPVPLDSALTWKPRMGFWGPLSMASSQGWQSRSRNKFGDWLSFLW